MRRMNLQLVRKILMTQTQATRVTFAKNIGFRKELNQRVDAYFKSENISRRDNWVMYLKTAIILGWVITAWTLTIFFLPTMWMKVIGCVVLGLGVAAIPFDVAHDANHGGYSSKKSVNYIIGLSADLIGISSYLWKFRHNYLHHTYTNILGHDVDIDSDGLIRISPFTKHKWFHKFQHVYVYFIYSILLFYWAATDVYLILFKRKYQEYAIPTPKPLEMFILLGSKFVWLGIFLGIPIAVGYTPIQALLGFAITYMISGFISANVVMMAHIMEPAEFIQPNPESNQIDDEWAIFQVRTTVDFAPENKFLNWYIGGLNYQTVHHLFPQICHIHYSKLAPILAEVCQEYGVKYNVYPTFKEAIAANYCWLKLMGNPSEINSITPQVL